MPSGFIAQVWTGTARTPNVYEGVLRERTFETAFLEYGAMVASTRGSAGRLWFLHDPVEDNPGHSWDDYRTNWECTVAASLLWPEVFRYEVAPWPERVMHGKYPTVDSKQRKFGERVIREPISSAYATELLTVMNALNDMDQAQTRWDCGTQGIGVVVSDTMMFERADPVRSDAHLGSFFGLALPLVEKGMPVHPVQLETATTSANLAPYKVLVMTYEGMKPMDPTVNQAIADWVKAGGALVFIDDDRDPYNQREKLVEPRPAPSAHRIPRKALFASMGLSHDTRPGSYTVGKGTLIFDASSPAGLTYQKQGASHVRELVRQACAAVKLDYREADHLALRRGPYLIAAGLEGSSPEAGHELRGRFIDLFAPGLPIVTSVKLNPHSRVLLFDIEQAQKTFPRVLASACKVLGEAHAPGGGLSFVAVGPDQTEALIRVGLPGAPRRVTVNGEALPAARRHGTRNRTRCLSVFPTKPLGSGL